MASLITGARCATVPLGPVFTALPGVSNDTTNRAPTYATAPGGNTGLLTFELDDDYDAVQLGMISEFTTAWGLAGAAVAPSASYGGDPAIGAAPYDLDGKMLTQMLPIQWSQAGLDSPPPGQPALSLATSASALPGDLRLAFATTNAHPAYGGGAPGVGWQVADGLGCIAPGTTVTGLTATTVGLSAPVAGRGCGAGQAIYFSPGGFGPFAQAVPPSHMPGAISLLFSDWVPLHSLPRVDGGFSLGAAVSGSGVAIGTTLAGLGYTSLTLSQALTAAMPAHAPIVLAYTQQVAQDAPALSTSIALASTTSIRPGQTVGGWPAIPPGTHVAAVGDSGVTLDQATTDVTPATTPLTFTNTTWTSLPAAAGDMNLSVPSTSARPLLHVRYFTQASAGTPSHKPKCLRNPNLDTLPCEAPLGLPPTWVLGGGQGSGRVPLDGLNFVSRVGGGAGAPQAQTNYPSFFLRFLGRHPGATLLVCGEYQASGAVGSVSGEANAARIAAAWADAQRPATPISVVTVASAQAGPANNFAYCNTLIDALHPAMMLIQDYSNNTAIPVATYRSQVQAVAQHALQAGTTPIIYIAYAESTAFFGGLPVAADVVNSTIVPLLTGVALTTNGSPTLVTGPGVPPNTTATSVLGTWYITLSQPATIPAGSILHYSYVVAANDGTSVTLTHPSFVTVARAGVTAPNLAGLPTLSVVKNRTSAQFSTPQALPPGTALQLSTPLHANTQNTYVAAAHTFYGQTDPWEATQLDGLSAVGTDPSHPSWMCDGCNTGELYTNDYGNSLIAARFVPLLLQLTTPPAGP